MEPTINSYENRSDRLAVLPDLLVLNHVTAIGMTTCLGCELADDTELRFNLPPGSNPLYPESRPQLYVQIYFPDERDPETHTVAVRSELESKVISLLKSAQIEHRVTRLHRLAGHLPKEMSEEQRLEYNQEIISTRDRIVAFVESGEYLDLNR